MSMEKPIKFVFVDVDNTILDFDKCAYTSLKNACKDLGVPFSNEFYISFLDVTTSLWKKIERGVYDKPRLLKERFNIIFKPLGINYDGEKFETHFRKYLHVSSDKILGANEFLEYLHSKYTVCIATNASHSQQGERLKNAGLLPYIDYIFSSFDIGFDKPDKRFFDACFDKLGADAKNYSIIVGDSLTSDMLGGKNANIKTIWFNRENKPDTLGVDYIIKDLLEIKNIL